MEKQTVRISMEMINEVLAHLGKAPYEEVADLIQSVITDINTLQRLEMQKEDAPEPSSNVDESKETTVKKK